MSALAGFCAALAQAAGPSLPDPGIRDLIAEARGISAAVGDTVWPGYSAAPFQVLFVDGEHEYLFCTEGDAEGFAEAGTDPATGCSVDIRDRQFPPDLLATFPAVNGVPTIVVGAPEATGKAPRDWMITLLHEHFHQLQTAHPAYHDMTAALDLANNDETGQWMLDYPFPYDDPATAQAFGRLAAAALGVLEANGEAFEPAFARYRASRRSFMDRLDPADRRYLEFQLWQEGVARWTEAELAAASGDPALEKAAAEMRQAIQVSLRAAQEEGLGVRKRTAFYPLGAAEAEMLQRSGTHWRADYWDQLSLGPLMADVEDQR